MEALRDLGDSTPRVIDLSGVLNPARKAILSHCQTIDRRGPYGRWLTPLIYMRTPKPLAIYVQPQARVGEEMPQATIDKKMPQATVDGAIEGYDYTYAATDKENGVWWNRKLLGLYFPVVSLSRPQF
jgi:hypothetical protein